MFDAGRGPGSWTNGYRIAVRLTAEMTNQIRRNFPDTRFAYFRFRRASASAVVDSSL